MKKRDILTKFLASVGTGLVWFPILAAILLSAVTIVRVRAFLFDYLIPAELFPVVLFGGGLLIWAALRARARRGIIAWGMGSAVVLLLSGQALAVATGLASGESQPAGLGWILVLASIIGYSLAVVVTGVGGILLLRDLFKPS